jgi:predicted  nucleic acid-binding Zn-ribbon protein
MSEPEDLEARVDALEGEVADLRSKARRIEQDAAAARVLAGGADRDVADLGGEVRELRGEFRDFRDEMYGFRDEMYGFRTQNNRLLNAMREDLTDLRTHVDNGFAEVWGRLDGAAAGQERIVGLLNTLIDQRNDPGDR